MVRPVEDEDLLCKLDKIPWEELRGDFRKKATLLRHKVFYETPAKKINGRPLTGEILADLIEQYVEALNKGASPNITSA